MSTSFDWSSTSPTFGGGTGGWLKAGETEEKYAMTWTGKEEKIFEMPTGGAAIMKKGENLIYFAKKEQCLALSSQLRTTFKISDYKIYRVFATGEVQYLHPKDGSFPEKVNAGRIGTNNVNHSIGKNLEPVKVKFSGKDISQALEVIG